MRIVAIIAALLITACAAPTSTAPTSTKWAQTRIATLELWRAQVKCDYLVASHVQASESNDVLATALGESSRKIKLNEVCLNAQGYYKE